MRAIYKFVEVVANEDSFKLTMLRDMLMRVKGEVGSKGFGIVICCYS